MANGSGYKRSQRMNILLICARHHVVDESFILKIMSINWLVESVLYKRNTLGSCYLILYDFHHLKFAESICFHLHFFSPCCCRCDRTMADDGSDVQFGSIANARRGSLAEVKRNLKRYLSSYLFFQVYLAISFNLSNKFWNDYSQKIGKKFAPNCLK